MNQPGFTAAHGLYKSAETYLVSGHSSSHGSEVSPALCGSSPCLRLPSGRVCLRIPIINKKVCVNVPSFGSWKVKCCLRFGIPPFKCSLSRC